MACRGGAQMRGLLSLLGGLRPSPDGDQEVLDDGEADGGLTAHVDTPGLTVLFILVVSSPSVAHRRGLMTRKVRETQDEEVRHRMSTPGG